MRRTLFGFLLIVLLIFSSATQAGNNKPFHYVYYLFLKGIKEDCADCYIPMMITKLPLDAEILKRGPIENLVIVTYERDSIWHIETETKALQATDVVISEKDVMLHGKHYRFQDVDKSEAIALLTHPEGTIPISRIRPPVPQDQQSLVNALIKDLSKTE